MRLAAARQEDAGFGADGRRSGVGRRRRPRNPASRGEAPSQRQDRAVTPRQRKLALIGVPVLVVAGALIFWLQGGRYASTENAFVKADIAQIASEVPGRIIEVRIQRPFGRHGRRVCSCASIPSPISWRSPRPRPRSIPRAPPSSSSRSSLREIRAEAREAENKLTYLAGAGQAPARSVGPRRDFGREARADQQRGAGRAGSRSQCCSSASRASRPRSAASRTGRPTVCRRPREAGVARSCGARSRLYRDQGAARRHRGQFQAPAWRAGQGADAAVLRWSPIAGPGWRPTSRKRTSPTSPSGRGQRSCSTCIPTSPGMPRWRASARQPAPSSRSCRRRMLRKLGEGRAAPAGAAAADRTSRRAAACAPA